MNGEQLRQKANLNLCFFHDDKVKVIRTLSDLDRARVKLLGVKSFGVVRDTNGKIKEVWGFKSAIPTYNQKVVRVV